MVSSTPCSWLFDSSGLRAYRGETIRLAKRYRWFGGVDGVLPRVFSRVHELRRSLSYSILNRSPFQMIDWFGGCGFEKRSMEVVVCRSWMRFFDACQRSGPVKRRHEGGGLWPEMWSWGNPIPSIQLLEVGFRRQWRRRWISPIWIKWNELNRRPEDPDGV